MSRVKRGVTSLRHRRKVLKAAKGYRHARSTKESAAKVALIKAGAYAFAHRRDKKNDFRRMWHVQLNAALRPMGHSFSKFIGTARKKNIALDKKILAGLAADHPETFKRVVTEAMK
jgi:large subunit ribosomal protein L20